MRSGAMLCIAAALVVVVLRMQGFVGLSNDDAARALIAARLLDGPTLDPTASSWLPLHSFEVAAAIALTRSIDLGPRIISFVAACALAHTSCSLARRVGASITAAFAMACAALVWRWSALSSAAGAVPELPCAAFVLATVAWLPSHDSPRSWPRAVLAGLALTFACGHRYEAWFAGVALVLIALVQDRTHVRWVFAVCAAVIPVAWLCINHHRSGDAFDFVHRVESFRRAEGPLAPLTFRALRYPLAALRELGAFMVLAVFARHAIDNDGARSIVRRLVLAAVAVLAGLTLGDLRGGGPTHHAARALVLVHWLLVPVAALGLTWLTRRARVVAVFAWGASVLLGAPRARDWHDSVARDAICAGDAVRRLRATRHDRPWVIELARQDFLWVEVRSEAPSMARADRTYGAQAPTATVLVARAIGAHVAAVSSTGALEALAAVGFREATACGGWRVLVRDQLPKTCTPYSP